MKERCLLHSWPLNRKFTQEEWYEYQKKHPNSSREVVFSFRGFDFNVNGVCLNPKETKVELNERIWCRVRTWLVPKGLQIDNTYPLWRYSCEVNDTLFGGYSGSGEADTEEDAILRGFARLRFKYQKEIEWYKGSVHDEDDEEGREYSRCAASDRCRRMIELISRAEEDRRQLTLF